MDLRILHLHPSVLNVAGDGGNVRAVEQRARWRGIDVAIRRGDPGDALDPAWPDITIIGGGQDTEMRVAADGLRDQARALRDSVEAGGVIFAVCAGLQLLGRTYVPTTGEAIEGLGMLDLETRGGPTRFMQHAACEVELDGTTSVVVGFENHSGLTELGPGAKPFGTVVLGAGNNGVDGTEGATIRIEPSGMVNVYVAGGSSGNSIETTVVQLVADALGVDIDDVATIQGDTAVTPFGAGACGSRSASMTA